MRIVEVIAPAKHKKELVQMARFYGALDTWWGSVNDDGRQAYRMLVPDHVRQQLMDGLEGSLETEKNARIIVHTVDATIPRYQPPPKAAVPGPGTNLPSAKSTREELYQEIAKGAELDRNFVLLVVLSTIVAAIGLAENSVAVVIGAMVIAPLLGPIIGFAFATSIGDKQLAFRSMSTGSIGLGLAFALAMIIGLIWPMDLATPEIASRTNVGLDSVALALASGAAAVLSLTTGLSSTLVGVMVAVALLPPTAVLGMVLGAGRVDLAFGAALLLAVNIVCVLLSAKLVFLARGIRPRTWLDRTKAKQSTALYIWLWVALLLILIGAIYLRQAF